MSINKKNVVWWTGITNPDHNEKYGGFKFLKNHGNFGVKEIIVNL